MCCGSRRSAWRNASISPRAPSRAPAISRNAGDGAQRPAAAAGTGWGRLASVAIRHTEPTPVRVWGAVTGRAYEFPDAETAQAVDPRDAAILMRDGPFRRATA